MRSGPEVSGRVLSLIYACFLVATATRLDAQIGGSGAIQGVVSDPSGAAVPGATVAASNVATGVNTTGETTKTGYYVISPLPAGEYSVTVTAAGFERTVQEHVTVDALAQVGLNLTFQIGGATQQVTVTGAPPAHSDRLERKAAANKFDATDSRYELVDTIPQNHRSPAISRFSAAALALGTGLLPSGAHLHCCVN
jgi:hypothetical protein